MNYCEIDDDQGCIWFTLNKSSMMAIAACKVKFIEDAESEDEFYEASESVRALHGAKSSECSHREHCQERSPVASVPPV